MADEQPPRSHVPAALYRIYERRLARQVRALAVPRHVGVILDGNRRHGRQRQLTDPEEVYTVGANKLDDLLNWCVELGIPAVTLWVLSTDNLARKPQEVSGILAAIETKLLQLAKAPQIHRQRVRVRAIGRLDLLPAPTLAAVRAAEVATQDYDGLHLTIAAAYGGRQEITDAVQSFLREQLKKGKKLEDVIDAVTPDALGRHIYSPDLPDPDLIIRTSGEIRLSGFLLWQSTTSEFYFSEVNWPAFRKIDFLRAIRSFQGRTRRYGL
ncbi:MAG TPA: polyprenyl diphosphate synthase [Xanthobacteraceae bacterium]|jgi:short-chain Z-isoprenyl diphosphate synthase|nr:polyprenyl diphosphate synthase [Xanthobacteraceae bacterium]